MSAIVHIGANGTIQLPPEILAQVKLNTPYEIHAENAKLVLEPATEKEQPFWKTATPEQRAERFREWADSIPKREGPPIPDEALRRENMYD
jgi:hypothetical protein